MVEIVHCSGKRKTSIARATLKKGKGVIRINSVLLSVYHPELAKEKIMEPLILAEGLAKEVDIKVNVKGGGWQSRAEAARMAIARALVEYSKDKSLKETFSKYDKHLLIADTRRTEPNKPYRSAARAKRQTSKR